MIDKEEDELENSDDSRVETETKSLKEVISETYDEVYKTDTDSKSESSEKQEESESEDEKPELASVVDVAPPDFWKADHKAMWDKVPAEFKSIIREYEKERGTYTQRQLQEIAEERKSIQRFNEILQPVFKDLQLEGVDPTELVGNLIAWDRELRSNPEYAGPKLLQRYGIDVTKLAGAGQQQSPQNTQVSYLENEIQNLKQHLVSLQQAPVAHELSYIAREIDGFKNERDTNGNLVRPYVDEVEDIMEPIIRRLKVSNPQLSHREALAKAYDEAIWAYQPAREILDKQRRAEDEAKRLKEAKEKSDLAKKRTISIKNGGGVSRSFAKPNSVRAVIDDAWDQVYEN